MVHSNFWKKLVRGGSKHSRRQTNANLTITGGAHIELMEPRCLLSISSVFNADTGALNITSNGRDSITVGVDGDGNVTLNGAALQTQGNAVAASTVISLEVKGGSGNNKIDLSGVTAVAFTSLTSVSVNGGNGNDSIIGSEFSDYIFGGNGNDSLNGLGGRDSLVGGNGNDVINGGDDDDELNGGNGNDSLDGGAGHDTANGGTGKDTLIGGTGNDSLVGGAANDQISGNSGDDVLDGGTGNDLLQGGDDNDSLMGGKNNDTLDGGDGDDTLDGGSNNDLENGGAGDDKIAGNFGNDTLNGGEGNDTLSGDGGNDSLSGGIGNDHLQAGDGSDKATGDDGDDTIFGGAGDDVLTAGHGTDVVIGGEGTDTITADELDVVLEDGGNSDAAPIASDDSATVDEGGTINIDVAANDSDDVPTGVLQVVQVSAPTYGTLTLNDDGTFTYMHDGSENFSDSFTYKVNDGLNDSNVATVSITISPVNDNVPVAEDDSVTLDVGGQVTISVLTNDTDTDAPADMLTVIKLSDPLYGTLTLNDDGTFIYVHDGSENLDDSFTYQVNDGLNDSNVATVMITINSPIV